MAPPRRMSVRTERRPRSGSGVDIGIDIDIDIDEAAVRAADKDGRAWRDPEWRHDDGSFAER